MSTSRDGQSPAPFIIVAPVHVVVLGGQVAVLALASVLAVLLVCAAAQVLAGVVEHVAVGVVDERVADILVGVLDAVGGAVQRLERVGDQVRVLAVVPDHPLVAGELVPCARVDADHVPRLHSPVGVRQSHRDLVVCGCCACVLLLFLD